MPQKVFPKKVLKNILKSIVSSFRLEFKKKLYWLKQNEIPFHSLDHFIFYLCFRALHKICKYLRTNHFILADIIKKFLPPFNVYTIVYGHKPRQWNLFGVQKVIRFIRSILNSSKLNQYIYNTKKWTKFFLSILVFR